MRRRRKVQKYRGSKTHGGGAMKKRRGAGNRGGRGNAGSGKRGDAKKPSTWNDKDKFGMHGFKSKTRKYDKAINVGDLHKIAKSGNINLADMKITRLLGAGKVSGAYNITVSKASAKAIEKIEAAKGKVIVDSNDSNADKADESE